jgi:hypothetical protein
MDTGVELEREKWLKQYTRMTCAVCGEPLKIYLSHYPCKTHVRCLIKTNKLRRAAPPSCWLT